MSNFKMSPIPPHIPSSQIIEIVKFAGLNFTNAVVYSNPKPAIEFKNATFRGMPLSADSIAEFVGAVKEVLRKRAEESASLASTKAPMISPTDDAVESAKKEIALWFPVGGTTFESALEPWIYE
ncbi:hypothetical protein [Pseudomonas sp. GW101-3H06]|uniref:hypothetical protein n=1 Tax=Pseudomonas sp. GW101-3H06 TaxID=2751347 RepID=UPI001A91591F|nr:hypothetical protein [Pseudomonas sp. GW101-3H06]